MHGFSRNLSVLAMAAACAAVAGCTHGDPSANASLEQSVSAPHSEMLALAPGRERTSRPIVALPGEAGSVESVRTRDYVNGLRQDIVLRGGAIGSMKNSITILARTSDKPTLDETVPLYKPTEAGIRSEIGGQFQHVAMQVAERESSNAYGPYGLALGRAGGDIRCLYMWQWIDDNRLPRDLGVAGPVSLRIRICQAGTTFDAMAALTDHLTIGGEGAFAMASSTDQVHIIEAPAEAGSTEVRPKRHVHKAVHHRAKVAKQTEVPTADVGVDTDAPRYLAPSSNPASRPRQTSVDTTPTGSTRLPNDLPPQAYLGPKGNAY